MKNNFIQNSVFNVLYKLLNALFPLIVASYTARVLLPENIGKIAFAQNIVQYFLVLLTGGILNYGTREIAKVKDNLKETSYVASDLMAINFLFTSIACFFYYIIMYKFTRTADKSLYFIMGSLIIFNYINTDWFYQGKAEFKYIAIRSLMVKFISLILIFIFVKDSSDYLKYSFIYCMALAGNNVLNILNLKKFKIKFSLKNLLLKRHMRSIITLLLTSLAIEAYTLLDTTMIGILCEKTYVAFYTYAMSISKTLIVIISAIGGIILPHMSYYYQLGEKDKCEHLVNKVFSILLFIFIPSGIGLLLVSKELVLILFGTNYTASVLTLRIASLLVYALGFSNLFGTQILLPLGHEKILFKATIAGAAINVGLNMILIPMYKQNGAAFASVISEAVVTCITYIYSQKYIKISWEKNILKTIFLSTIGMVVTVLILKIFIKNMLINLVASIIFGMFSYIIINYKLKNPLLVEFLNILSMKLKDKSFMK